MDNLLFSVSFLCVLNMLLILLLRKLRQPYAIAYILAGVLTGPFMGKLFTSTQQTSAVGEIGLLLLMFFLGIELDIPDHRSLLLKPVIAQFVKIFLSAIAALCVGILFHLSTYTIIILCALLTFNSTAVVSEYLKKNNELGSTFGKVILNILLLQDILLAPMLTLFQFMETRAFSPLRLTIAVSTCIVIFLLLRIMRSGKLLRPAILQSVGEDHELQVFLGGAVCLGFGLLAKAAGLSGPIGSFVAGMIIGRTKAFSWLEHSLKPFRVFFVSFFFMSIGLQLDLPYIAGNFRSVLTGTLLMLVSNSILSAIVFRLLKYNWKHSLYGGAVLSQAGEFGILACTLAYQLQIIDADFFKAGVAITALSLLLSTTWITMLRKIWNASAR